MLPTLQCLLSVLVEAIEEIENVHFLGQVASQFHTPWRALWDPMEGSDQKALPGCLKNSTNLPQREKNLTVSRQELAWPPRMSKEKLAPSSKASSWHQCATPPMDTEWGSLI